MPTLYHATPALNLDSIRENGLLPSLAEGKIKGVWLHTRSKREWAILHTAKRHSIDLDDVIIIEVSVPRKALTRRWRGLWTSADTITPQHFNQIYPASQLSESPIKDQPCLS